MPLIKRSYEKQTNFLNGLNFRYPDYYPSTSFTDGNLEPNILTESGKVIINKFISQNEKRIKLYNELSNEIRDNKYKNVNKKYTIKNSIYKGYFSVLKKELFSGYRQKIYKLDNYKPFYV